MSEFREVEQFGFRSGGDLEVGVKPHPELNERVEIIMEARHRNALIALQIEDLLSSETEAEYPDEKVERVAIGNLRSQIGQLLDALDLGDSENEKRKLTAFKEGVDRYFLEREKAKVIQAEWEGDRNSILYSQRTLAEYVFMRRTNFKRRGKVVLERRGAFFLVFFEKNLDYVSFTAAQEDRMGQYHPAFRIGARNSRVITINGHSEDMTYVVEHEKQHLINELVLGRFSQLEPLNQLNNSFPNLSVVLKGEGDNNELILNTVRRVKDELLAYIREGEDPIFILDHIANLHLFSRLKRNLSEIAFEEFEQLLTQIKHALDVVFKIFNTPEKQVLLLYLLVDVPLTRFPERLRMIEGFYRTKLGLLKNLAELKVA